MRRGEAQIEEIRKEEEYRNYKKQCLVVCRDIYGRNTKRYKIMAEKIENCQNSAQLNNAMIWGRVNLQKDLK